MAEQKQKKQFRRRKYSSSSDNDSEKEEETRTAVEDMKELQKMRKRPRGVDVATGLNAGVSEPKPEEQGKKVDPFKLKSGGGIISMQDLKKSRGGDKDEDEIIGTSFAAETNRRDEDADMLTYVEEELKKRKGLNTDADAAAQKQKTVDDVLLDCPEHLRSSTGKKTEDMLSNQMLSGIPEVDLGIEAKIKNIESTEEAKQRMIEERRRKKEQEVSDFVPTNMAVNFVQHNRFNIEDSTPLLKKDETPAAKPLRVGDAEKFSANKGKKGSDKTTDKATDDFHYEKFKKYMRR
ncbi:splicing factor C9orf78 homolog [Lineus longissimus]|uniref:splicing factor C9orf78 homolog n=1 Tax=Lineus longissimus TaxID=88925 RepID=UPI00315CB48B